jgi:hypothetical protein
MGTVSSQPNKEELTSSPTNYCAPSGDYGSESSGGCTVAYPYNYKSNGNSGVTFYNQATSSQFSNPDWVTGGAVMNQWAAYSDTYFTGTSPVQTNKNYGTPSAMIIYNHADPCLWSTLVGTSSNVSDCGQNRYTSSDIVEGYPIPNVAIEGCGGASGATNCTWGATNIQCPPTGEWLNYPVGSAANTTDYITGASAGNNSDSAGTYACQHAGSLTCQGDLGSNCDGGGSFLWCLRTQYLGDRGTCCLLNSPKNVNQSLLNLQDYANRIEITGSTNHVSDWIANQLLLNPEAGNVPVVMTTNNCWASGPDPQFCKSSPLSVEGAIGFNYTCPSSTQGLSSLLEANAAYVGETCGNPALMDELWATSTSMCPNWFYDAGVGKTTSGTSSQSAAQTAMSVVFQKLFGPKQTSSSEGLLFSDIDHAPAISQILASSRKLQQGGAGRRALGDTVFNVLSSTCAAITRNEINDIYQTYAGSSLSQMPLNYQNLVNACSCFMPTNQYNNIVDMDGPQCDPLCVAYAGFGPGVILPSSSCTQTICAIEDVAINVPPGAHSSSLFTQMCGGNSPGTTARCEVYNVTVNGNSSSINAVIQQECAAHGSCYNGQTGEQFDCSLGLSGLNSSSWSSTGGQDKSNTVFESIKTFYENHKKTTIWVSVVLGILFILLIIIMIMRKKYSS